MDDQISAKEFGEMSANVKTLVREWQDFKTIYATKNELVPLQQAIADLKNDKHRVWEKIMAVGAIISAVVGSVALIRTYLH